MKRNLQKLVSCFSHHRVGVRALCMILSVILIFYVIPATVYAEVASAFSDEESAETATESAVTENSGANALDYTPVLYEVADLREEGVKHFHLEDGSYVAAQYAYPVHYLDDSGKWQDIDNSLTELGGMLANSTARIKFAKKITGNSTLFTLHDGNTKLTMSLVGAQKGTVGEATNYADAESDTELQKMMNLEKLSSRVLYADILDGVDLEYIAQSLNVKENVIVKEKAEAYSYTFELALNNLTAALAENGDVVLTDSDGAVKYTIPAPVVYDAAGVYAPVSVSRYSLESRNGNGKYLLTVTADAAWMNAADRVFPVTVDPTIVGNEYISTDLYIEEGSSNTALQSSDIVLTVSSSKISYWKINTEYLPVIPKSAYISKATISLFAAFGNSAYIGAYEISNDWDSTLTWNAAVEYETAGVITDNLVDYKHISTFAKWYEWDITELVEKWYDGYNYGVAFKQVVDVDAETNFFSNESREDGNYGNCRPNFQIIYLSTLGVEDYRSYSSHSAGIAGSGSIDLATGQLAFAIPTLSTTDSLMPYTPTLVYNSSLANKPYVYGIAETANTTNYMPYGFKLNICETVIEKSYVVGENATKKYYIYSDADGTEHFFYESGSEGVYVDESGLQKTLIINSNGSLRITDDSKLIRIFNRKSSNPTDAVSGAWYLAGILDRSGNAIAFTFDSYLRPIMVSLIPKDSEQIDFLALYYYRNTGKLRMVYNPISRKAVIFRYSTGYSSNISSSGHNYLSEVCYAHGNKAVTLAQWESFAVSQSNFSSITVETTALYSYNAEGLLSSAIDGLAIKKNNYLWSNNKLSKFSYVTADDSGQTITYTYANGYTDVRSSGSNDLFNDSDDIITRYVFDKTGRSISIYSSSVSGTEIYSATVGTYETQENVKNDLDQQVTLGGSYVNYLLNGDFELTASYRSFEHWEISGSVTRTADCFDAEGDYSAKFSPTNSQVSSIAQDVALSKGKYTLSMQYLSQNSDNVNGTVTIFSTAGSGYWHSEEVPLNINYDNGTYSMFSTSFNVVDYVDGGDELKIVIQFATNDSANATPRINVDGVMLENNIGASRFNTVNYGGFDASVLDADGHSIPVDTYWISDSSSLNIVTVDDSVLGNALKIEGSIEEEKYAYQRVYEISAEHLGYYEGIVDYTSNADNEYLVSGFAYSQNAVNSTDAKFRLRVDVIYYLGYSNDDVTVSHYYDFNPSCKGWQFTGGSFSTADDGYDCVKAIEVYCEYSYQPYGYALFDNISIVSSNGRDVYENEYYENGLIKKTGTTSYWEYYEYNNNRNLVFMANNRGEINMYEYDALNIISSHINCEFTFNNGCSYPYQADNPLELVELIPKSKTDYQYNTYGQCTQTKTYLLNESGSVATDTKVVLNNYSYDTNTQSKIFGALLSEQNGLGICILYWYDTNNGRLLSTLNVNEQTGMFYNYDEIGNLVGVLPGCYSPLNGYTANDDAESVTYTYDNKNLLATVSTKSTTYSFSYDSFCNVVGIAAGNNEDGANNVQIISYEYNSKNGKLNTVNYSNGFSIEYFYNDIELLTEVWYTNSANVRTLAYEYEYTSSGQVHEFIDYISGKSIVYNYDINNRLTSFREYKNDELYHQYSADVFYNGIGSIDRINYDLNHINGDKIESAAWGYAYSYKGDGSFSSSTIRTPATNGGEAYEYDGYGRIIQKLNSLYISGSGTNRFNNQISYTYKNNEDYTSTWVETYTSTVNNGTALTYTFTYDMNGNITKIVYSTGQEIRYVYDDIGQLVREDNGVNGYTYMYTYDDAGNLLLRNSYALTAADVTPTGAQHSYSYVYSSSKWGDVMSSFGGVAITYDEIGNPLSYYNGVSYTFSWTGTKLTSAVKGSATYSFTYNDEGIRTSKTKNGVTTTYYLSGSQVVAEETNGNTTIYLYDAEGAPLGMQYHGAYYEEDVWDVYWYEKNNFGDIVAVYDVAGTKLISYKYDAYGKTTRSYHNGCTASSSASQNPFRYRGYYYDQDLQLYYLNSRYYDGYTGRFISPDSLEYLGANGDLNSYNLYAYCSNNPVNFVDPSGHSITALILCGIALIGMGLTIGGVATDNNVMTAIGLTMVAVPAMISGVGALFSGATYLSIIGGVTTGAGLFTGAFATAEYQEAFTGNNWIIDTTGMSGQWYNGLMLTTAALATAGTIATGVLTSIGNAATHNQMMNSFNKNPNRWKAVKELVEPAKGRRYKGGISTYSNYINKWNGSKLGIHKIIKGGRFIHGPHFHKWI